MATDEELKQNQDPNNESQDKASIDSDPLESGQLNETTQSLDDDTNKLPDTLDDEIIDDTTQKKAKSINKILFIAIGSLVFIIIVITILFFMGVFDPKVEETPPVDPNDPNATAVVEPVVPEIPVYDFKMTDINVERLNNKLALLKTIQPATVANTSTDIPSEKEVDNKDNNAFYDEELESLFEENDSVDTKEEIAKEQEPEQELEDNQVIQDDILAQDDSVLLEEVVLADETKQDLQENPQLIASSTDTSTTLDTQIQEPLEVSINQDSNKVEEKKDEVQSTQTVIIANNQFLKFIQVATLKYKLYTQFLREIKAVDARISICQNEQGRIQIFIGPFLDDTQRNFVVEKINKNVVTDAFALEFTQEEFYKRCGINDPS